LGSKIDGVLLRSRFTSRVSPLLAFSACVVLVLVQLSQLHIVSVIGTSLVSFFAGVLTFSRARYTTERYVRSAIRSRLAIKDNQHISRLSRQLKGTQVEAFMPSSTHPSEEIKDALYDAEKLMGLTKGISMALVIPLDELTGIDHNCPSAASLLYSGRHPVVIVDNNLQKILDYPKDQKKAHLQVVAVLCHELAHLMGFNTRFSGITEVCAQFVKTSSIAMLIAYSLENSFNFGVIGAVLLSFYLIFDPMHSATKDNHNNISIMNILSRISLVSLCTYMLSGLIINSWPLMLPITALSLTFGLHLILSAIKRRHEFYADKMAALAMGNIRPLIDFFKSITTFDHGIFEKLFATHPTTRSRIAMLNKIKF
jgi:hypothetical protein